MLVNSYGHWFTTNAYNFSRYSPQYKSLDGIDRDMQRREIIKKHFTIKTDSQNICYYLYYHGRFISAWMKSIEYRVKPEPEARRMTNKELARWLAECNGQKATINGNVISYYSYELDDDNKEVEDCMVREWDSDEWHEPLVEVKE